MISNLSVLTIPFLLAMFLAINMGGSGTSPAFSAAYGANVIKKSLIPGLFGVMVLIGALMAGNKVTLSLGNNILAESFFTPFVTAIILLSIGLSMFVANLLGVPQSTSQSTVLSIAGAAVALDTLHTDFLLKTVFPYWFILPIVSFVIMYAFSRWVSPKLQKRFFTDDFAHLKHHKYLKYLLILASLYVAFSIGANNVANAAAPIAALTANELGLSNLSTLIPIITMAVLIVAPCFAIGSSLMGHKVTKSTGKEIVELSPFNATMISLLVASLLVYASIVKGIPTSLVQLNSAAFIALSMVKNGFTNTVKNSTVRKFFIVWAIAPIFSFLFTYLVLRFYSSF